MKKLFLAYMGLIMLSGCWSFQNKQTETDSQTESKAGKANISVLNSNTNNHVSEANSDEPKLFVNETDWKGLKCEKYSEDDGYTTIQKCIFPDANMTQVYDVIKRINENLKDTLPQKDIEYISEVDKYIKVCYKYKTTNDLLIEIDYQGGVTCFEIMQKDKSIITRITYAAD